MSSAGLDRLADSLEPAMTAALKRAALAGKTVFTAAAAGASGGDGRLSGVGRRGAKIGVRFDTGRGRVLIRATGPWQFIEGDRRGGYPIPKRSRRRRPRLVVNGQVRTGPVTGGARRGTHAWGKAEAPFLDDVGDIFGAELDKAVRRGR